MVAAVALATAVLLTGTQRPRSVALRLLASLAVVALAASVAVALIAEHIHYATDTLAGSCVAAATVLTAALALDVYVPRLLTRLSHQR